MPLNAERGRKGQSARIFLKPCHRHGQIPGQDVNIMDDGSSSPIAMESGSLRYRMLEAVDRIQHAVNKHGPNGGNSRKGSSSRQSQLRPCWIPFGDDEGGKLTIVAAPPGLGRTALAAGMVSEFLTETKRTPTLAWFSLRESAVDGALRMLCVAAGLPPEKVAEGLV